MAIRLLLFAVLEQTSPWPLVLSSGSASDASPQKSCYFNLLYLFCGGCGAQFFCNSRKALGQLISNSATGPGTSRSRCGGRVIVCGKVSRLKSAGVRIRRRPMPIGGRVADRGPSGRLLSALRGTEKPVVSNRDDLAPMTNRPSKLHYHRSVARRRGANVPLFYPESEAIREASEKPCRGGHGQRPIDWREKSEYYYR